ncbi:E3 ubiquitin-protein ligase-like [Anguilla rostrata]|uniref:RING-type domain-containing protein n=1 Tax=Anguilla anguilla TaxID=7936 RepID=A0A0E9X353_ANGAN|nr:hypothetical protein ANANG_G00058250 [Anguilla anguilla]
MCSELECGICYRMYNTGRRSPRELSCGHTFCERCLVTLCRPSTPQAIARPGDVAIVCPLCRCCSTVSGTEGVRMALRLDESVLGRILAAGVLDRGSAEDTESEDEDNDAEKNGRVQGSTAPPRTRKGKLWRSMKRFCGRLTGNSNQDSRRGGSEYMTDGDIKDLALMSCYMM